MAPTRMLAAAMLALSAAAPARPAAGEAAPPASREAASPAAGEAASPAAVRISGFAFEPATIRVRPGTPVRWVNRDEEPHTVTSDAGAFGSRGLDAGDGYAFTFEKAGRFPYHCALHPHMTGVVVVE